MTDPTAPGRRPRRVLVYGDVDLNLLDGSAIWAVGVVETFAAAGADVTLLLKRPVITDRLIAPLSSWPNVRIVPAFDVGTPTGERLGRAQAATRMIDLDRDTPFDAIVLRGFGLIEHVVDRGTFDGRLWSYLTDIPQVVADLSTATVATLERIARASHYLLCQTEELRGFLESSVPGTVGRCVLLPPSVPDLTATRAESSPPIEGSPLRIVYAGKFAPRWNTEAMTRLPALLAERGIAAELHMIGDKIHSDPADPGYAERMLDALQSAPGVTWHGGRSRAETLDLVATCHVGLGWRDRSLDASLELSTKVLEYGALGVPVILGRTPMHERLLGADYPLFAGGQDEVLDAIADLGEPNVAELARERCRSAADAFSQSRAVGRVRDLLADAFPAPAALIGRPRPVRLVVAGHDFKFMRRLIERFQASDGLEVRVDDWPGRARHDESLSRELAAWADVVICEWCGPNAIWYAEHRRPDQRLYVRLHRFELDRPWPALVDISQVERVICVSPHYARVTRERTGWQADKVAVIPNWVDTRQLDRPKLPGARFHLGMIGVGERRKRFDLALDILEQLRREDDRFVLFAKTKMPWEYAHIWARPDEVEHARSVMARIQTSPLLDGAVVFDTFGPDVPTWLRRIGRVLSTSDDESFHLAPAEGMASRAVPTIRDWPGAETTFDPMWVRPGPEAMAAAIIETMDEARWVAAGAEARDQIEARYGLDRIVTSYIELIATGAIPA
ncbi:MAG TPA: glycosyltransferase [Candidatus Limnocylindrales bacterium]